jgi:hypothetical protein
MNVTNVSANIRYSAEVNGAWRTIELGAEATVTPNEDWHIAQEQLYHQLGQQMKTLWSNGSGKAHNGPEKAIQPAPSQPEPKQPDHFCREHQTPFKKHTKDGRPWWSHRQGGGWHKES